MIAKFLGWMLFIFLTCFAALGMYFLYPYENLSADSIVFMVVIIAPPILLGMKLMEDKGR